ncbi:TPA: filamentous hemagglutinin N-terminal domain-containing protein [Morganella morganii]|uniref:filamentous hemagglutinin N-terminal domain-containing protein n=2 Tax=Enterobacterales TaxID=91347 RepID=UPI001A2E8005|nr:filamentous hemagglutinin N-terminal domain-containing protein [Morganella morganii]MCU6210321.1 filamentous hemagglutinin N-terminal domain-containing protein [Morganella morganii]MCU6273142.1 filamentous hemagglutinin N-terminal domain-containing protein [Morganella morganii]HAT1511799.1 filamentous hemagglutinin N-terminal domain-containing protein [Morganella morganii]
MKFKLLSAVILTALSATAFSATEQTFSDGLKIKLNEKSTGSDLRMYKGKPVLAISSPDNGKISHNYFDEFNVGKEGMYIGNHKGANTIITEVVSHSPSLLNGNIDIIGKLGTLVIANPNGITTGSDFGVSNTKNLELATAKIVSSADENRVEKMKNVNDGKLSVINANINGLEKLSLISNSISVENSEIDVKKINSHLLVSAEHESRGSGEYTSGYFPYKTEKQIITRGPSTLYIDDQSALYANNVNLNLVESEFVNDGYIESNTVSINSKQTPSASYSNIIDIGDIVHVRNNGTIYSNIFNLKGDSSILENHGQIIANKKTDIDLSHSIFTNYGKMDNRGKTSLILDNSRFINTGKMQAKDLLISYYKNSKLINNGDLYTSYYYAKDANHDNDQETEQFSQENTGNLYVYDGYNGGYKEVESL